MNTNAFEVTTLLIIGYLLVCIQAAFDGFVFWMQGYIWFPCLVVAYALVRQPPVVSGLLCIVIGFWIDSLSVNPLGLSILSMAAAALLAGKAWRNWAGDRFLSMFAPGFVLGFTFPVIGIMTARMIGESPLGGWRLFLSTMVSGLIIGVLTPPFYRLVDLAMGTLRFKTVYHQEPRDIREIHRG